jgi:hypothetical protein
MEEAPENGKESSHSAHANGMNESNLLFNRYQGDTLLQGQVAVHERQIHINLLPSLRIHGDMLSLPHMYSCFDAELNIRTTTVDAVT